MSRYDGLIIPRSYSEYINKTDAATLSQALALPGVMDAAPTESSNKAARSGGIYNAIDAVKPVDTVTLNNMHSVTSDAVSRAMSYSTNEVNTGKKWIDGRTIYRKVFTATLQTNEQVLTLNISSQMQSLVSVKGLLSKGNVDFVIPYCFIDGSYIFQISTYCHGANLFIISRSSDGTYFTAGCVVRAIVEYTKTTD